jgi:2-keto-3-deoxy-6-phosphogluconate aldolase
VTDALLRLREARLVAVIRADDADDALAVAEAVVEGGLTAVELTYTTPGAGTAMASALMHGATAVKLFPASSCGTPHLRALFGPFPGIKVVPTGGIALDDIGAWLEAGAWAVGVGGKLAPRRFEARRRLVERCRSVLAGIAAESVR